MRLVFWHNCLSPHQLPYVVKLVDDGRVDEVIFAAPFAVDDERKDMGWSAAKDDIERQGVRVMLHPSDDEICAVLKHRPEDSFHLFGGISGGGNFVFHALQLSMQYALHRVLVAERPNGYWFKWGLRIPKPAWMHRIKFWLKDYRYARHMESVFAMGSEAVEYYRSLGMGWTVHPFAYCTAVRPAAVQCPSDDVLHYIFCGSLIPCKDPLRILEALSVVDNRGQCDVSFVGDGMMRTALEQKTRQNGLDGQVRFLGIKPQQEVPTYMQQADVLILPSIYDGWGAVVNEALQSGCFVICSDAAGASDLIRRDRRLGMVFHRGDGRQLADCMSWCNGHIAGIRADRQFRRQWSEEHISGSVIAGYMVDCLTGYEKASE